MMPTNRIDKGNYEEFFLLYVDNELPAADRAAVEAFVAAHPDLQEELELLLDTRLIPEEQLFHNPEVLLKPEPATRRNSYILLRWLAPAAAAVWLLFMGISRFSGSEEEPVIEPSVTVSRQEPVTKTSEPRITDNIAERPFPVTRTTEKRPVPVSATSVPEPALPIAKTEIGTPMPEPLETTEKAADRAVPVSEPIETQQNLSALTSVKNNYASEALFHPGPDAEETEEEGRVKKGFRGLVRKATRVYQKVIEPEGDKPLIRLSKADIEL